MKRTMGLKVMKRPSAAKGPNQKKAKRAGKLARDDVEVLGQGNLKTALSKLELPFDSV